MKYAIVKGKIITCDEGGTIIDNGTVLVNEGKIVAVNNYTPYGDDASKYKGFDESVKDLKEILRKGSERLEDMEAQMVEMVKNYSFLSTYDAVGNT